MLPPEVLELEDHYMAAPAVPSPEQVAQAVEEIFVSSYDCDSKAVWHALFPTESDPGVGDVVRTVTGVPMGEFGELCCFVRQVCKVLAEERELQACIRLMLAVYCHIMEADFPVTVVYNLLRALNGEAPSWLFVDGNGTRCRYPREKIAEVVRQSEIRGLQIGNVLHQLWNGDIRNAFSHSHYVFGPGCIMATGNWSPISRAKCFTDCPGGSPVRLSYLDALYEGARAFVRSFHAQYLDACRSFPYRPWPEKPDRIYIVTADMPKESYQRLPRQA